ncbi:hypothetical protein ISR94_01430 [Candidatus Microgenomates bacterium]|nr:hypothetical protein [Candidatus Microgenomates bacterium]
MNSQKKIILVDLDHTLYEVDSGNLYPDAIDFVKFAQKQNETYLFTEGDHNFQKNKIEKTGLDKIFGKNIRIYDEFLKIENSKKEFSDKDVILIDDKPLVIDGAISLGWETIRIKRGRYKNKDSQLKPNNTVKDLQTIVSGNLLL